MVIARDEDGGITGIYPVTAIMQRQTAAALYLTLENAAGETSQLGVTAEHPLFDVAAGWTQAGELVAGDQVADADMQPLTVLAIVVDDTPQLVHNLEVGGAHTYFAGEMAAWAHNTRNPTSGTKNAAINCATGPDGILRCEYCQTPLTRQFGLPNSLEFDHADPFIGGGGRNLTNIICSCRTCNRRKGATDFAKWLERTFGG